MADKLVMRWWPAESRYEWQRPSDYPGMVGIATQVTSNHAHATMAAPESGYHELQQVSSSGGMASVVEFADPTYTLQYGEYIEHEIFLIQPDGVTVAPFSVSQLPMDVIIAGVGANPYQNWPEFAWRASRWTTGRYAGGVVEVGVYRNDEYTSLLSVWVAGSSFSTKPDGTSWDHPALPGNSDSARLDSETGILWATLDGDFPIAPFWAGFKDAVEVNFKAGPIPPEPEPEPEP